MSVDFFIIGLDRGGAETQLVRVACELARRGWDVRVLTLLRVNRFREELDAAGIPVWSAGMTHALQLPGAFVRVCRVLRARRPDVLCSFMVHADLVGRWARRIAGVPVHVSSVRSTRMGGRIAEGLFRLTAPLTDAVTANARATVRHLAERRLTGGRPVRLIPNAISSALPAPRSTQGRDGAFRWVAVGRLAEPKDYPNVLRAFALHRADVPEATLAIAGAGDPDEALRPLCVRYGIEDAVTFLGFQSDVAGLLARSDALVHGARWEGMPNALMEAALAGRPAVCTDVGDAREVMEEGETGYLVPAADARALGAAMTRLARLPEGARERMGAHAQALVLERYAIDRIADLWEETFEMLLQDRGAAPALAVDDATPPQTQAHS